MVDSLSSWNDGAAKDAIVSFVERACAAGSPDTIPVADRVAVFDNDGTLWCEKPMPIQLDFILRRLAEMAKTDAELRNRQPWKAAYDRDYGWLASVIAEHYAGDDTNVPTWREGSWRRSRTSLSTSSRLSRTHSCVAPAIPHSVAPTSTAPTRRWSSSWATSKRMASRTTSPPAAVETS